MGRQYFQDLLGSITADGTAVANTTTETAVHPAFVLPANYMQDGRRLRITASGKLSTTGTPTMTFALRWGGAAGTLLATTEALTMGSGVANVNWWVDLIVQTRTNGSSGSLMIMGKCFVHTAAGTVLMNVFGVSGFDAPAAVGSLDLTVDTSLALTAKWSAASSSNTLTCVDFAPEALN